MNMRIVVCLALLFLLAISMPSVASAEKAVHPANVVEKAHVEQSVEINDRNKTSSHVHKGKKVETSVESKTNVKDVADRAKEQAAKVANGNTSVEKKGKSNDSHLPEQASDKAKEAVNKVVPKQVKEKKPDPTPQKQKQKETDSSNPKGEKKEKNDSSPKKEPVVDRDKTPLSQENKVVSNKEPDSSAEKTEDTTSDDEETEEESPKSQESRTPLPNKTVWEIHIFQVQLSIKTPLELSQGSSKAQMDFLNDVTGRLGVSFNEPFVFRQHVFRNQWVNAPPSPPPKFALSFLRTV